MGEIKQSNEISIEKFVLYAILSFGIYELVWIYRSWKFFKEKEKSDISPFWRTFFAIFFIYNLLEKIQKLAKSKKYKKRYGSMAIAIAWIAIGFLSELSDPFWLISILTFIPLIGPVKAFNYYWKKSKMKERPSKGWHTLLIILCSIFWLLVIIGFII